MSNHLKTINRFLVISTIVFMLPLFALAQQEGDQESQPEPTLYGEGAGDQLMLRESQPDGAGEAVMKRQAESAREMSGQKELRGESLTRRSRVANAVQEMLQVADRNEGVGTKIREIAQDQNRVHEEMEKGIEVSNERKSWVKFFIGPNYGELKEVENQFEKHLNQLNELRQLRADVENQEDAQLLQEQLQKMEQIATELKGEVESAKEGFSLFGWLNRWLSK